MLYHYMILSPETEILDVSLILLGQIQNLVHHLYKELKFCH